MNASICKKYEAKCTHVVSDLKGNIFFPIGQRPFHGILAVLQFLELVVVRNLSSQYVPDSEPASIER
jgi:hypothetical protein